MPKIPGGYILKARCVKNSMIANFAPCVREVWDYLLREANYKRIKYNTFVLERGQLFRSYKEIKEGLKWKVGYRTEMYSRDQIQRAMNKLVNAAMIATTNAPRGVIITICNYSYYQTAKNYERTDERTNEPVLPASPLVKKEKERKEKTLPDWLPSDLWNEFVEHRKAIRKPLTSQAITLNINKLKKLKDAGENLKNVIDQTIANRYTSVFAVNKGRFNEQQDANQEPTFTSREELDRLRGK